MTHTSHYLTLTIKEHVQPEPQPVSPYRLVTAERIYLGPRTVLDLNMESRDGDLVKMLHKARRQINLALEELLAPSSKRDI